MTINLNTVDETAKYAASLLTSTLFIRKGNGTSVRLTKEEVMSLCRATYKLGMAAGLKQLSSLDEETILLSANDFVIAHSVEGE